MPARNGLPSGCVALEDVDLGRRTTGSHNGNHLGGVADLRGEPRRVLGVRDRSGGQRAQLAAHSRPSSRRTDPSSAVPSCRVK